MSKKKTEVKAEAEQAEKAPQPLLAIVIPVRNCAGHALRMLQDIDTQMTAAGELGKRVKIVLVNDASDDETMRFLHSWKSGHDGICSLEVAVRSGAGGCRNSGVQYAKATLAARYVAFFDADDFLMPGALKKILDIAETNKADCIEWGFRTLNKNPACDNAWIPKYANPDEWVTIPVAPWLHAIRPHMIADFPTHLLTDDAIWWYRQAQILQEVKAKFYFIHEPLYIYDRRTGGCTRASDFFSEHPTTLETAAVEDTCMAHGFPDRYVSDCLRNLAEMYDMRNTLTGAVQRQFMRRFRSDIAACWVGRWGW